MTELNTVKNFSKT